MIRRFLYKIYWKLEGLLVPGLRSSQYAFAEALRAQVAERPVWLDIGCGHMILPEWMSPQQDQLLAVTRHVVGIDLDQDSLRKHRVYPDKARASVYDLPFAAGSFDLVSANMVVEHINEPEKMLLAIRGVLRTGGRFVFHTPNRDSWLIRIAAATPEWFKLPLTKLLEGRAENDIFPTHYCFNRKADIEKLAQSTGFQIVSIQGVSSSAVTGVLGPLAIPELLVLRRLKRPEFENARTNIVAVLQKEPDPAAASLQ